MSGSPGLRAVRCALRCCPPTPARWWPVPAPHLPGALAVCWLHGLMLLAMLHFLPLPPELSERDSQEPGLGPGLLPEVVVPDPRRLSPVSRLRGEGGQRGGWAGEERGGRSQGGCGPSADLQGLHSTVGSACAQWEPAPWILTAFGLEPRPSICVVSQGKEAHRCSVLPDPPCWRITQLGRVCYCKLSSRLALSATGLSPLCQHSHFPRNVCAS